MNNIKKQIKQLNEQPDVVAAQKLIDEIKGEVKKLQIKLIELKLEKREEQFKKLQKEWYDNTTNGIDIALVADYMDENISNIEYLESYIFKFKIDELWHQVHIDTIYEFRNGTQTSKRTSTKIYKDGKQVYSFKGLAIRVLRSIIINKENILEVFYCDDWEIMDLKEKLINMNSQQ
jgi:hypothetical protein